MKPDESELAAPPKRQRIAKLIARAGLCSRRDAEAWIVAGRVSLNGTVLSSPAVDVAGSDMVVVDGMPLPAVEPTRLFLFHKPRGLVTSDHDPEGRETVADFLKAHWPQGPRVVTVGRLDINTEGLLLLTNDGGLARVLELPQTGWVRRYRVRAKGTADPAALDALVGGIAIDGVHYAGIEAKLDRMQGANCWLTMGLREGKNREIKRVLEHLGLEVNRLIRLSFGPFQLLDLPEGKVEEVRTRVLREQLGERLASQAGVELETEPALAPVRPRDREMPLPARPAAGNGRAHAPPRRSKTSIGHHDTAPASERHRPTAGTRKHVSTLRKERQATSRRGPRQRIERSETSDRSERPVVIERLVSRRDPMSVRPERRKDTDAPTNRQARAGHKPMNAPGRGGQREDRRGGRTGAIAAGNRRESPSAERHRSPSARGKSERVSRSGSQPPDRPRAPQNRQLRRNGRTDPADKIHDAASPRVRSDKGGKRGPQESSDPRRPSNRPAAAKRRATGPSRANGPGTRTAPNNRRDEKGKRDGEAKPWAPKSKPSSSRPPRSKPPGSQPRTPRPKPGAPKPRPRTPKR